MHIKKKGSIINHHSSLTSMSYKVCDINKWPVIHEIQTESSVAERETEICSGSNPLAWRMTRGSDSGTSTANPLNLIWSSGDVTGSNGPSSVVGIEPLRDSSNKIKITQTRAIPFQNLISHCFYRRSGREGVYKVVRFNGNDWNFLK